MRNITETDGGWEQYDLDLAATPTDVGDIFAS